MSVEPRGHWSTRFGFVLAAAGSAIGLGNIWKFPYTAGKNGGALFLFAYLGAVVVVGLPILLAEVAIGRASRKNPVGAFRALSSRPGWTLPGWMGVLSGTLILAFYGVVAGWSVDYVFLALRGALGEAGVDGVSALFTDLVSSPPRQILWQAIFMFTTTGIVAGGISSGIERGSRILMPGLFLMLVGLLVYAMTLPGAARAIDFLLTPRPEEFSTDGLLAALGQAFFSLSLGMGAMITYGSYLDDRESLVRSTGWIVAMDTMIGVLAGFVIFPLVFSFGLEPGSGPGLIFQTVPTALVHLPGSAFLAFVFFLLLTFAALTSAISLLEVVVAYLVDERDWSRHAAAWTAGSAIFVVGIPCAIDSAWIDRLDYATSNVLLPIGGLLISLFAGWGLSRADREIHVGSGPLAWGWTFMVRFVTPVAVIAVFLSLWFG